MKNASKALDSINTDELLTGILKAIKKNQIEFHLQPIVSLPQRKTRFFECYSRVKLNDSISLQPLDYMQAAEDAGLMPQIDMAILKAITLLARRIKRKQFSLGFFINIAESSLQNRFFLEAVSEAFEDQYDVFNNIFFDISAEAYEMIAKSNKKFFETLIQQGTIFCLDQPDDPSWDIAGLNKNGVSYIKVPYETLYNAIRSQGVERFLMAKSMLDKNKIDLIATKIETQEQLDNIIGIQADYGQGYLFGVPMMYGTT